MTIGDDIIAHCAAGTLPQLLVEEMRSHYRDDEGEALRKALVDLHNSGLIDVLEPARAIATSSVSQPSFFFVQHVYTEIIPELEASVPPMLEAVKALVKRAGNDLAAARPNDAFRRWIESNGRARSVLELVDPANPEDAAYVFLALLALAKTEPGTALDLAITFLAGQDAAARWGAAKAIGALPLASVEAQTRAINALIAAREGSADDNLLGQIIAAAVDIARKVPAEEPAILRLIDTIAESAGDQVIHQATTTLMFHADDLPSAIVAALARIAHKIRLENSGTIDHLDGAAAKLLQHNRIDEALALVAPVLSAHEELCSLDRLDSFAHGLLQLDRERLAAVIAAWLLSRDRNLGMATGELVGEHHGEPLLLEFDAAALSLSEADTIVLAHRAIGYLFMRPLTAASFVLSLVRTASAGARQAMEDILFEPLLINFSGELSNWLKAKTADEGDPALSTIERLLARLDAYLDGLRQVGRIKELRPSEREQMIEGQRRHEAMLRAHKEAEKKSVLMSLVSRSVLLYGNRSISYFEGPDGARQRSEMKLHSFSHSIEAPRLDVLEPFELDYTLRVFRSITIAP